MARVFVYEGREWPDTDPNLSVDEVRQSMADFFPELSNAETKETKRGEDRVIEFKRRVGTKGWRAPGVLTPEQEAAGLELDEQADFVSLLHNGELVATWGKGISREQLREAAERERQEPEIVSKPDPGGSGKLLRR